MTDTDKSLASELRDHAEIMKRDKGKFVRFIDAAVCLETADRIEALSAEVERLRESIKGPYAWLDSWAQHVGNCQGGYNCACGLVRARSELSAALRGIAA